MKVAFPQIIRVAASSSPRRLPERRFSLLAVLLLGRGSVLGDLVEVVLVLGSGTELQVAQVRRHVEVDGFVPAAPEDQLGAVGVAQVEPVDLVGLYRVTAVFVTAAVAADFFVIVLILDFHFIIVIGESQAVLHGTSGLPSRRLWLVA
ncbi:hypothetical protein PG993_003728 [Apiospora rasikravindrae]|uniref:Uncharacterized protein n=1 Tax=Apiospora rasikravindrae TaxID=990691 RepID=A0ABR1U0K2_9PEZI